MALGFPTEFKELVRNRTDLVELVSESVSLTPLRGGMDYVGLCPFHDDHNPSFHVYPDRQSYRCWVCQEGGDCFSYLMKKESLGFREALEYLAQRANLELPQLYAPSETKSHHAEIYEVLTWAEQTFHNCLLHAPEAEDARKYLKERGFQPATIAQFRIGYHPDDWQWLIRKAQGRFSTDLLLEARLIGKSESSQRTFDYFIDRVIFPIADERGRTVAFGGRILPGHNYPDMGKYWNSPESPLFRKSRILYGLKLAADAIRKQDVALVMEGYTDCMMSHQQGVRNTVIALGTALTEEHVTLLKRFTRKVVLVFDGDAAGQMAAERALTKFLMQDVDLRILTLPGGLDPADYLAKHGKEAFEQQVSEAPEAWEYKLRSTIERIGLDSIDTRQQVLDEMLTILLQVPRLSGSTRENIILRQLTRMIGADERVVRTRMGELRQPRRQTAPQPRHSGSVTPSRTSHNRFWSGQNGQLTKHDRLECELLEILFAAPETVTTLQQEVGVDEFQNPYLRRLLQVCVDLVEEGFLPSYDNVTSTLEDPELKNLASLVDEMSRQKNTAQLLQRDDSSGSSSLLKQTLDQFRWRREEQAHQRSKGRFAQRKLDQPAPAASLDPHTLELLKQAAEFHQKRANHQKNS